MTTPITTPKQDPLMPPELIVYRIEQPPIAPRVITVFGVLALAGLAISIFNSSVQDRFDNIPVIF